MVALLPEFAATVRSHDWSRHIAIQFAPEDKRGPLTTLHAFNAELDRITRIASDPLPGEIRLQWWREVLSGERQGEAAGHPLAAALVNMSRLYKLPLDAFDRLLEAKAFALYYDAFPDLVSFEAWCGESEGALLQLATLILEPEASLKTSDASGHGGIALAVGLILSELPVTRARGQCWIPADLLAACGLTRETWVAGTDGEAVANAVAAFSGKGLEHFSHFKEAARSLPNSLRPAFLPVFAARLALERASAKPQHVQSNGVAVSNLRKFLSIIHAAVF
jgi:phytoene synthase